MLAVFSAALLLLLPPSLVFEVLAREMVMWLWLILVIFPPAAAVRF